MKKTASGPWDAALRHGGIHRLVHGGSDEGGARGTEPDIRLSLRDGLAPGAVLCRYGSCRTGAGCAGSPPGQLISLRKTELSLPDGKGIFFGSVNS